MIGKIERDKEQDAQKGEYDNRKISAQFKNQAQDYVRRSIEYENNSISLAGTGVRKISFVACGFSCIKIHYTVNIINEVFFSEMKYRYDSDIL